MNWHAGALSARTCAAAIVLAASVPYLSTLDNYFVADDFGVVQLLASKPWSYFPRWFATTWMDGIWGFTPDEVRPFPALSYQLTSVGRPGSPVLHHVFNILMHAATALVVYAMARRVARLARPASLFAAMVFAVLPVQAESVAWITGRVDSMPAFFYIASFVVYARWRDEGRRSDYAWSLVLFAVALFTKQNAITMVGTLAAYELLLRRPWGRFPARFAALMPFALLTTGYLLLRLVLFGEVAREGRLGASELRLFGTMAGRHLNHVVLGDPGAGDVVFWTLAAIASALVVVAVARRSGWTSDPVAGLAFFGPVWWTIGVAPILVAGYESPRHVYLASAGWAVVLGIGLQLLATDSRPLARRAAFVTAAALVLAYAWLLRVPVARWNASAELSRAAVRGLESEAREAAPGTLFLIDVPVRSWEWALPFAAQPPFTSEDLTRRARIVSPRLLHCCRQQWFDDTRRTLRAWQADGTNRVVALRWTDGRTGMMKLTERTDPEAAALLPMLLELETPEALDSALAGIAARATPAGRSGE